VLGLSVGHHKIVSYLHQFIFSILNYKYVTSRRNIRKVVMVVVVVVVVVA
jgi:hypothetical protein